MKGAPGLLIAVGLGIIGAIANFVYISNKGKDLQMVDFIAIAENVKVNPGDRFSESHFTPVSVPANAVKYLDQVAVKWSERFTVIGEAATKSYVPGEILLHLQLKTLPVTDIKKLLAADERVLWIPVDTRTFVPSLVNAGDNVSFIVAKLPTAAGQGLSEPDAGSSGAALRPTSSATETIGPFRILALGNRLGSQDVMRAAGFTTSQENVMAVAIKVVGPDGEFEEKAQRVLELLRLTNFQQVQVILHPAQEIKGK